MQTVDKDYMTAYAILGVQRLRTCVAVPIVTEAKAVATVSTHSIYKMMKTKVLTAQGKPPEDKGDVKCGAWRQR